MELIKEIPKKINYDEKYTLRKSVRSIVSNDSNKIALINASKKGYHKLPGGGIEGNEDKNIALKREIKEEVGAEVNILDNIGIVIEYKEGSKQFKYGQIQISYCYFSEVVGELEEKSLTDKEKSHGFKLEWLSYDEAIEKLKNDSPENKRITEYITKRDLAILKKAKEIKENKQKS